MQASRHDFLSTWFTDCSGSIEVRVLPEGKQGFFSIDDHQGIDNFVSQYQNKTNVYFGLGSRNGKGGTKAHLIDVPGVWADIDFDKIPGGKEGADKLLKECPLQPTFIIQSGNGYHCYWRLKEPTDNIGIVERINKQLAQFFESDPVHNADRILRLPETFNYKYSPKRPVEILFSNIDNQYNQSDFESELPPLKKTALSNGKLGNAPNWQEEALKGTNSGRRHHVGPKLIGRYIQKGLSDDEILPIMEAWDRKNTPSIAKDYGPNELTKMIKSLRETDNRNHPPQVDPSLFPNIFSGAAKNFSDVYSQHLECPYHYFYIGYLTFLGLIITGKVTIDSQLKPQPRLYPLFIGKTAGTKKSTAIDECYSHFKNAVPGRFGSCFGLGSPEGLERKVKDLPSPKRILLAYDEFKTFVSKASIPQSVLLQAVTTLFEKNHYENATKTGGLDIQDAHLVMLSASTIETYHAVWDRAFTAIGLNNRLFLVPGWSEKKYALPGTIPQSKKEELTEELHKVLRYAADYPTLRLSTDAREIYEDWYLNLDSSIHTDRLDTYALRFMILFAVNDMRNEIDEDIVKRTIELMNWQLEVRRQYDPIDAESRTAKMQEKIRRVTKGKGKETERGFIISDRALRQSTNANREGLGIYLAALKQMREVGEIQFNKGQHELISRAMI